MERAREVCDRYLTDDASPLPSEPLEWREWAARILASAIDDAVAEDRSEMAEHCEAKAARLARWHKALPRSLVMSAACAGKQDAYREIACDLCGNTEQAIDPVPSLADLPLAPSPHRATRGAEAPKRHESVALAGAAAPSKTPGIGLAWWRQGAELARRMRHVRRTTNWAHGAS